MQTNNQMLVVDLDQTLIKSDMLYESFWSGFSKDWLLPLKVLAYVFSNKVALKKYLYDVSEVDIKNLPYNNSVINYIKVHKSKGGKVSLMTGSYYKFAEEIALHLNLFDEVYGSINQINLKGIEKAKFQIKKYGSGKFDYIGDSASDLKSWSYANKAIIVNASNSLKKKCIKNNPNTIILNHHNKKEFINNIFKEVRPHQWLKNLLVFVPMLSAQLLSLSVFYNALLAFVSFCFLASSVYIFNDLLDLESDRTHPQKCKRPFASGSLQINYGSLIALGITILGFIIGSRLGMDFFIILLTYFFTTITYSLFLKRKALYDIFTLAGLYTIRMIGGGVATKIEVSFWLLAFALFIFLSLAAIKRQSELFDLIKRDKNKVIRRGYEIKDINFISQIAIFTGLLSSLIIALYMNSPDVLKLYPNPKYLWFACVSFLFWIVRICFQTSRGAMYHDPIVFAFKDKVSFLNILIIISFVILAAKL